MVVNNHQILYISAHSPTKLYPQAGQKIAWHHLQEYAIKNNNNIDIVVIANQAEITAAEDLFAEYGDRLYTYPLSKLSKLKSCLTNVNIPLKFATRSRNQAANQIKYLLSKNDYSIIHFEYSHAAVYLDLILQNHLPKASFLKPTSEEKRCKKNKLIISIHDIVSQSFLRKATKNFIVGIEVARIFAYENKIYNLADELWVLSGKDKDILTSLFSVPAHKIIIQSPPLSDFVYQIHRKPEKIELKSILFWGAMDRPENEQAVIEFIDKCFNKLSQKDPEYKFYIVGSKPSQKILSLQSENIIVTGFIDDPTPFFESAAIGVVPLSTGAGLKLKTLEMLQSGLPVLSTSIGAEGVSESEKLFINNNLNEWENIIKLVNNQSF